jgi:prevent-host-death family protein
VNSVIGLSHTGGMKKVVNLHDAKTHLSRLVDEAVGGGEVVIARANRPLVQLVPVAEAAPPRRLGTASGHVVIGEDFDAPLDDFSDYT